MFVFETFHTSDTFNDALENIAKKITVYSKAFYSKEGRKWLNDNIDKYSYTGYAIKFSNNKYELFAEDYLKNGIPIYVKLCNDPNSYWMLSVKREFIDNVEAIVIYCNNAQLFNKYVHEVNNDYNEAAYIRDFKAKISHELNGHAIQYLYNPNMRHIENTIDALEADINFLNTDENDKEILRKFFYYLHPLEIEARLNEIYTIFKENGLNIIDCISKKENCKVTITLKTLQSILDYIDKNTKLSEIQNCINYIYDHALNDIVSNLNKKYKIYKETKIDDAFNNYRIKILKQLYKILTIDLNYKGLDFFKFGHPERKSVNDIPDKNFDLFEYANPFNKPGKF
ncbi:MAG: hypothetical protein [Wendovervirus sonii]|uniref:Uncharacterized protein n=1 Tax=phage Lak_Megaphage_Sonny TaxID=3109229 RepID=A0ABZ0Z5G1_9CAUD|nr:MAG: hypothetical protein [phage Lak_Megaphage_Sonny]